MPDSVGLCIKTIWSKGEKGAQSTRVFISNMVAGKSPSDKLTFEQRPKGEEQENLMVMWEVREGRISRQRKKQIQRPRGKAKRPEWIRHGG